MRKEIYNRGKEVLLDLAIHNPRETLTMDEPHIIDHNTALQPCLDSGQPQVC